MHKLAIRMALRDWKKAILVAIVLAMAESLLIYYQTMLREMSLYEPTKIEQASTIEVTPEQPLKMPKSKTELLISVMTWLVFLTAALFQLTILVVDMVKKRPQYKALEIIGVNREQLILFPLAYALLASIMASLLLIIFWYGIFPYIKPISKISYINPTLVILVMALNIIISLIIGNEASNVANTIQ